MKNFFIKTLFGIVLVLQVVILSACGSGSGSSGVASINSNPSNSNESNTNNTIPTVKMVSPKDITNASIWPTIGLQFSEPVQNVTESTVTLLQGESIVAIGAIKSESNNTYYSFMPTKPLSQETEYTVIVNNQVVSISGQSLSTTTFTFTTTTAVVPVNHKPTVDISPANNESNVGFRPLIKLQFNEAVQNVNNSTVTLFIDGKLTVSVPITDIIESPSNTYTFMPKYALGKNEKVSIALSSDITSVANNESLVAQTSSFTTLPNHYAYVSNYNESTLTVCSADSVDGQLSSCKQTGNGFVKANGVAVNPNGHYIYVANTSGSISICPINSTDGTLGDCGTFQDASIPSAYGLAIDPAGRYLYVATYTNAQVAKCEINQIDGTLSNCTSQFVGNNNNINTYGVALNSNGTVAYVTSPNDSLLSICGLSSDGAFIPYCGYNQGGGFSDITGIVVDPKSEFLYTVSLTTRYATSCSIVNKLQLSCNSTGGRFDAASDIKLDLYGNFAYVTNNSKNSVSVCAVKQPGVISACRETTGDNNFDSPKMMAVY